MTAGEKKGKKKPTHIFPTHGFKHLLQLDSQLLDVVDQDAGLHTERKKNICSEQELSISTQRAVTNAFILEY